MSVIRRHSFSEGKATAIKSDGYYIWIAFKGTGGNCYLYKSSVFNPETYYFELTVPVDEITRITTDSTYVYLAVDDADYIAVRYSKNDPLATYNYITKPVSIIEKSVDVISDVDGNTGYWYILTPGEASAENAKVVIIDSATVDTIIDLTYSIFTAVFARSMTFDTDNDNIWVATYTDPINIIKITDLGNTNTWTEYEVS